MHSCHYKLTDQLVAGIITVVAIGIGDTHLRIFMISNYVASSV